MSSLIYLLAGTVGLGGLVIIALLVRIIITRDYSSLVGDIAPRRVGPILARATAITYKDNQLAVAHFVPNPLETTDPVKISRVAARLARVRSQNHSTVN